MTVNEFLKRWIMHYVHPEYFYIPWADNSGETTVTFKFTLINNPIPTDKYTLPGCTVQFYLYDRTTDKFMGVYRSGNIYVAYDKDYSGYAPGTVVVEYPQVLAANEVTIQFPQGDYSLIEYSCTRGVLRTAPVEFSVRNRPQTITIEHNVAYTKIGLSSGWITENKTGDYTETPYGNSRVKDTLYGDLSEEISWTGGTHHGFVPYTMYMSHVYPTEQNSLGIDYTTEYVPHWVARTGGTPGSQSLEFITGWTDEGGIKYTPRDEWFSGDKTYHSTGIGNCPWSFKKAIVQKFESVTTEYNGTDNYIDIRLNGQTYCWNDGQRHQPTSYDSVHFSGMAYTTLRYYLRSGGYRKSFETTMGGDLGLPNVATTPETDGHFTGYNPAAEALWEQQGGHSMFGNGYVGTYAHPELQTITQSGTMVEEWGTETQVTLDTSDGYVTTVSTSKTDSRKSVTYSQTYGWTMDVGFDYDSIYTRIASYWQLTPYGTSGISIDETIIEPSSTIVSTNMQYLNTEVALDALSVMYFRFFNSAANREVFTINGVVSRLITRNGSNTGVGYENSKYDCTRFGEGTHPSGHDYWVERYHLGQVSFNIFLFAQNLENYLTYTVG